MTPGLKLNSKCGVVHQKQGHGKQGGSMSPGAVQQRDRADSCTDCSRGGEADGKGELKTRNHDGGGGCQLICVQGLLWVGPSARLMA